VLEDYHRLAAAGISVVVAAGTPAGAEIDSITTDNRAGIELAVDHLLELGHRRVGYISAYPRQMHDLRLRLMRETLAARSLPLDDDLLACPREADAEGGRRGMRWLLERQPPPTAVVAINDVAAVGALREARSAGVAVPGELSLVGFDDIPMAASAEVPLTTVRQPIAEIARLVVERLSARMEGHEGKAMSIRLAPELVVRESTAPPAGTGRNSDGAR
jgi:LacI family transcriptional regulator